MITGKSVCIGTHSGTFHADEVVACVLLKQLPEYSDAVIIRTRDPLELDKCDVVVDVGGQYDPVRNRYDHHQRGFNLTFQNFFNDSPWNIKLSSAGLVYIHFGKQVIGCIRNKPPSDPLVDALFHKIYSGFIVEIDAIDNGVTITDDKPKYTIHTCLSSRISFMNPPWNKPVSDEMTYFKEAMSTAEKEFIALVNHYADSWYPARNLVLTALKQRKLIDPSGQIMVLDESSCPWKSHVFDLERKEDNSKVENSTDYFNRPLFCIYKRNDNTWAVQAIPISELDTFKNRLDLPKDWRGLRDEELSHVVGIPGCVFVHINGFMGVHKTRDGALEMARLAIKTADSLSLKH